MGTPVYLDYAAATPVDPLVVEAMMPYYGQLFYNPSADYQAARQVRLAIDAARSKIAYWLGCQANEIIFTAGGTEADNLAINGIMSQYPDAKLLISSIEHEAVRNPAANYDYQEIPVDDAGLIDCAQAVSLIDDRTVMISLMYANNEIGTIQPLRQLAQQLLTVRRDRRQRGVKLPLWLHSDACQAGNYLDLHVNRLGVDLLTLNGGKLYGPKQSGALYVSRQVQLKPQIEGGGQERNLRSGTENVAADIGLATALDLAQAKKDSYSSQVRLMSQRLVKRLEQEFPNVRVNGSKKHRLPNNVHVTLPGQDNEVLLIGLDQNGILAAAGSACSAAKEESSHVLAALGLSEAEARSSLRLTLGRQTTSEDIDYTIEVLKRLVD